MNISLTLSTEDQAAQRHLCPLCSHLGEIVQRTTVLGRHDARLVRCSNCATCWFQNPAWLDEAYETTLTAGDIGLVMRNAHLLNAIALYLRVARPGFQEPILDFGAGTGLLVRSLRDIGYDARYFDHYGGNCFAKGHEGTLGERYGLATAVEVLEHVVEFETTIHELLSCSTEFLFSTSLIDSTTPAVEAWPYYGLDHGQHVMFLSRNGLEHFARSKGMWFASCGDLHLITPSKRRARLFAALMRLHTVRVRLRFRTRRSLLWTDVNR